VLGALAASSCCLVPLALFGLGVGGAWIGYLTRLAPYQPYFIGFAAVCLGLGYWLRHRWRTLACAQDEMCARPLPSRIATAGFVVAGVLIVAALTLDFVAPFLFP
jgi:mercuric ion transport protein